MNMYERHADTVEYRPADEGAGGYEFVEDPFGDDLGEELAAKAPRQYLTRSTVILVSLVLLVAGFVAGAQVQKRYGPTASAASTTGGRAGGGNFGGGGGQGQGGGGGQGQGGDRNQAGGPGQAGPQTSAGANVTVGTVKLVDGATVYLQLANGDIVTVKTTGSTVVALAQPGSIKDLTPGVQVTVEGAAAGEGAVTATKVTKDR